MTETPAAEDRPVAEAAPAPPGRPVRLEPTPPGFWPLLLGLAVGLLAPFFGTLIGSGMGVTGDATRMSPLYWGFFTGGLIGAMGLLLAGRGAILLLRHTRARRREDS